VQHGQRAARCDFEDCAKSGIVGPAVGCGSVEVPVSCLDQRRRGREAVRLALYKVQSG
jgi:hypothetical protein